MREEVAWIVSRESSSCTSVQYVADEYQVPYRFETEKTGAVATGTWSELAVQESCRDRTEPPRFLPATFLIFSAPGRGSSVSSSNAPPPPVADVRCVGKSTTAKPQASLPAYMLFRSPTTTPEAVVRGSRIEDRGS